MIGDSQRLDAALVARGLASGREKAKELIAAGLVTVNGHNPTIMYNLAVFFMLNWENG